MKLLLVLLLLFALPAAAATRGADGVLTYHGAPTRGGDYVVPGLTWAAARSMHLDPAFDGTVKGHVYAQPLYWRPPTGAPGMLIVATESNIVQALDARTGHTLWRTSLGAPVPRADLPCGNIDPLGVTGTPVIDPQVGAVFLDAAVLRGGAMHHLVFALSLADGAVLPGWPVDVQAALHALGVPFTPSVQNQRAALALLRGRVFVAFGGHFGDCGPYHGIVLGIDTNPVRRAAAWRTRGLKGGIWAPAGISAADGSLFITTGNTEGARDWADGEGVFRLGPDLAHSTDPRNFFAPTNWKQLDEADLDMSGVAPLPLDLPGGAHRLLALGKDGKAYLLDRADLGGIAGALAVRKVAGIPIITAPAVVAEDGRVLVVFQARRADCPDGSSAGLAALAVTAGAVAPAWCAKLDGRGAPIITTTDGTGQPIVWVAGAEGDNRVHAFRADTGAPLWTSSRRLTGLRHFVTMLATGDRLYIAGDGRVFAFTWAGH